MVVGGEEVRGPVPRPPDAVGESAPTTAVRWAAMGRMVVVWVVVVRVAVVRVAVGRMIVGRVVMAVRASVRACHGAHHGTCIRSQPPWSYHH